MKLKLPKPRKISLSINYLYIITWLLVILLSGYMVYFLNENFYKTIAQIRIIEPLRKQVAPDIIDIEKVERVLELINDKMNATSTTKFSDLTNPFDINVVEVEDISEDEDSSEPEE